MKRALICGVSGQDGAYLAQLLLSKGYAVTGSSRDAEGSRFAGLDALGIKQRVELTSMAPEEFHGVLKTMQKCAPDEVYYLAGQSSVALSFEQPSETIQSITLGTLNLLEACRLSSKPVRLYQAGSSECFGDTGGVAADETTPFAPRSPYAVAKAAAYWLVRNYREAYGLYACTGILFNHESVLRPERFVTQKIVRAAKRIAAGSSERLTLGRLDVSRDWGWAPEYVDAMWRMLQQDTAEDFVIATGTTSSLEDFVRLAFEQGGLDWRDHVQQDHAFMRPTDIATSRANPARALARLGWSAQSTLEQTIQRLYSAQ